MYNNKKLPVLCMFVFCALDCAQSMDFNTFKTQIATATGPVVYGVVNPMLAGGLDAQTAELRDHMEKHGHFGYKSTISKRNTKMNWSSFYIKSDGTLINQQIEQDALIQSIWNSKTLIYSDDISGTPGGVCLNDAPPNVHGVVFDAPKVARSSVSTKDIGKYAIENRVAFRIAQNAGYVPNAVDFPNPEDLATANAVVTEVKAASPRIVTTCSMRIILDADSGAVVFNTSYPF